jgi:excisionase family DNA binding protein
VTLHAGTRLLTTRGVADRLALSPETILRRVRAGELPAYRIASNALRFDEAAIDAYLERSAVTVLTTLGVPSTTTEGATHE